ncbi:hypothetical protein D0851_01160 [Marinobacter sp. Arc7-DN-1]|nr:hypothetical protein D0851_01160 [Marinobacter sp. Arc7-DN-1]
MGVSASTFCSCSGVGLMASILILLFSWFRRLL